MASESSQSPSSIPASPDGTGPRRPLDPYRDWLGIASPERPPSPYQLLGLRELENDSLAIAEAARAAKKTLRAYQIGQYRTEALALMTEIGQAADLLTNEEKKSAYDAQRRQKLLALAQANFPQAELSRPLHDVFADWLGRGEKAGLPISQLLPDLMQWCLQRPFPWPSRGPLGVPLPLGLWLYFEAAVVGQCVARSPLEKRIQAVKQMQQLLGVGAPLSRIINLDIARRPDSFLETPLVRQASDEPRQLMQAWVDRLAKAGGGQGKGVVLEVDSAGYRALAFLLGFVDDSGRAVREPVRPQMTKAARRSASTSLAAALGQAPGQIIAKLRHAAGGYPQLVLAVKIALAVSGLIILLFLLLLVLRK